MGEFARGFFRPYTGLRLLLLVSGVVQSATAQSVSLEPEDPDEPPIEAAPPESKPPSVPKRTAPPVPVVPPRVVSAPVDYPKDAQGEHEVVLHLTISPEGSVTEATAVVGEAPFTEQAVEAAKIWKFEPAKRGGEPVAAKIRFLVRFVPPSVESESPAESVPATEPETGDRGSPAQKPPEEPTEVLVVGERKPIRQRLGRAEIRELPGAFGDPYRAIEVLPGVVPIASGVPYFYVRGAPPGNVGYFFDGIPVPLLYHFAAGPGVLHPAFIDHVDLYPGAYPARYGRFAGGIVAGEMAPPGYRFRGEASIRLIDSGAMIEAPFADNRGSVMLGGRFSYTGLVLSLIVPEVTLNYWDYQGRARYALDDDDSLELLVFGSGDFLAETEELSSGRTRQNTLVDLGFHRAALRWDRDLAPGRLRNTLLVGFDQTKAAEGEVVVTNRLVGARSLFTKPISERLSVELGADLLFESLRQELEDADEEEPMPPSGSDDVDNDDPDFGFNSRREDFTAGVWGQLVIDAAPGVEVTPGLRADLYLAGNQFKVGVDPRVSTRFEISEKVSLVHGLALVHQAPSFVIPVPGLKPSLQGGLQRAVQSSAGVEYKLPAGFSSSFTLFQNAFFNMTDFISLVQLNNTTGDDVEDFRTMGQAYGAELMVRRSLTHDLGGFLSYTLSRSVRAAGRLKGPATTDRTHVVNLAGSYNLGKNWRIGSRLLFYSGIPARVAYLQAAKSPPRTPLFWRLDWKLQKRWMIAAPNAWWGLKFEVLNTTLNKEALDGSCNAYNCEFEEIGPVTIPSIGVEGAF